jgi:alpha-N-arabinofuranosidase
MKKSFLSFVFLSIASLGFAQPTLTIQADKIVRHVSPTLYGLMTEEINHSYDGGLYAELIQNRAFRDDDQTPRCWSLVQNNSAVTMALDTSETFNGKVTLRLDVTSASKANPAGVANEGYWGIPVFPSTRYHASFYAKASQNFSGPVILSIVSDDGTTVYARARVSHLSSDWKMYEATLKTGHSIAPTAKTHFVLTAENPGTIWLGYVSLFPPTWKNQPNGFRKDLLQMLIDMNPKFLRMPGGNYLEGNTIATHFDWKKTIGPVADRPGHNGPWGYRSSDGMGLMEFLRWCEDMNAEPVLAVYAGYALSGRHVKPGPTLEPYVQDALDEIEYVSGSTSTKWGAERAKDGHPKPFPLHYIEIGNEDWFDRSDSYDKRFTQFFTAIKAQYPQLKCISTIGNDADAHLRVRSSSPDLFDEHYYRNAQTFFDDAHHFDNYDRKGPQIFVGEWASYETSFPPWDGRSSSWPPTPNMTAALADAAWMTGMERNSDLIPMQSYAPLLVNVNPGGRQWRPNLIGYDTLHCFGSPSYYAIKMFGNNVGDEIPAVISACSPIYESVTEDSKTGAIIIKLVNSGTEPQTLILNIQGASLKSNGTAVTLAAAPDATNSIDDPTHVVPAVTKLTDIGPEFNYTLPADSIAILTLKSR